MWPIILSIIALGIIAGVSFYAFKLLRKLREQNTLIKQAKIARTKRLKESMVIIAKAMQNGDCNHSEGVIRFINCFYSLLDNLCSHIKRCMHFIIL